MSNNTTNNKNKNKICHITMLFKPYFAGRAIYLENKVFKTFATRGLENIVITSNYDDLPSEEVLNGVSIFRVPLKKGKKKNVLFFSLKALPLLFKLRKHYRIIHMHGLWDIYGLFILFAKIFRKKLILHMTLIGSDDPVAILGSYKFMKFRFKYLSKVDVFITISTPMSENYKKIGLPDKKLYQIPNGVDFRSFYPALSENEKQVIRKQLNLPENGRIVSFVGAIIERKGVDLLIRAWSDVNRRFKDSLLLLIGPDTFDGFDSDTSTFNAFCNSMKNIVQKERLSVKFLGKSDQVPLLLRASDLFVLPSRSEGFPNVVVEAMATGLPVILSEMDGIAYDLITPGTEGFVIRDNKELAKKIIFLLENEEVLKNMGKSSRKRALEHFDIEIICNRYISIYNQLSH